MGSRKAELMLNTITGPKVTAPAISPETLRDLNHPYYNFLHVYCLESQTNRWHGRLKNIGLQLAVHDTVVLPPNVAEMLGLYNDDVVRVYPSDLSEATIVFYEPLSIDEVAIEMLPNLQLGTELRAEAPNFNLSGAPIRLTNWEPMLSYLGPNTEIVNVADVSTQSHSANPQAEHVVTDEPGDDKQLQETNFKLLK